MKVHTLKCTNCAAALEIEDGVDTFFCRYCGYKMILVEISEASIRAKVRLKEIEHRERIKDKQYEHERYKIDKDEINKKKENRRNFITSVVGISVLFLLLTFLFGYGKMESISEEKHLEAIVDEIMDDIDNGDYDEAYIKANSLYYTSNWSTEIEEKWDETRKALLKQIKKAEKANSKSKGFFDWFK